jgi:osmoprotectant transport system permease protein
MVRYKTCETGRGAMLTSILQLITDPDTAYAAHSWDYIRLCLVSIALAIAIAVPLGIMLARQPLLAFIATNGSGLVRAVPSIVLLVLFTTAGIPGLGFNFTSAAIALIALGIPPILLNTIAGLRAVDPAAIDAGRGMGMTGWQVLSRVQIPLVLPVIAAGVRTAAVQIVATATIAGVFGVGGWGEYIYLGIFRGGDLAYILIGAVPVAILALMAELGFGAIERALTPPGLRVQSAALTRDQQRATLRVPEVTPSRTRA